MAFEYGLLVAIFKPMKCQFGLKDVYWAIFSIFEELLIPVL
jgi:hypothetical protein